MALLPRRRVWPDQNPPATDVILHLNVPCAGGSPAYLKSTRDPPAFNRHGAWRKDPLEDGWGRPRLRQRRPAARLGVIDAAQWCLHSQRCGCTAQRRDREKSNITAAELFYSEDELRGSGYRS